MSSEIVPIVPAGGNTNPPPKRKQISPSIRWCFTFNNYSDDDVKNLCSIVLEKCKKYIVAKEVGECGTPHLQGYIEFKSKARPCSVFKFTDKIHFEKSKGTALENVNYCSKDGDVILISGLPKPLKTLACENNLFWWQQDICDLIEHNEPDDRTINWYWSKAGNIGKTTFCKYLSRKYGAICLGGKSADMKNGIVEYYKKNGHCPELIVINIPRSFDADYVSYTGIEEVKDMFFYSGKYEGGMVNGNSPHLFIFSNERPDYSKVSKDRWSIINIDTTTTDN